jgi:hypothetical protein
VSNSLLWAAYTKAIFNTALAAVGLKKQAYFKVTPKGAPAMSRAGSRASLPSLYAGTPGHSTQLLLLPADVTPAKDGSKISRVRSISSDLSQELPDLSLYSKMDSGRMPSSLQLPFVVTAEACDSAPSPSVVPNTTTELKSLASGVSSKGASSISAAGSGSDDESDIGAAKCSMKKGVLDPLFQLLLLGLSLATVAVSIYKVVTFKPLHPAVDPLVDPYLFIPFAWGIVNSVGPILFFVYLVDMGRVFQWLARVLRLLMTAAPIVAFILVWLSLPREVDLALAQSKGITFISRQGAAASVPDVAMLWNSSIEADVSGGWLPSGSPSKPLMPIAFTTSTLAWALTSFDRGFPDAATRAEALDNVRTGATYIMNSYDQKLSKLIVQVGDPSLYTVSGQPSEASGKLWTTLAADPTRGTTQRYAFAYNPRQVGADATGSASAALAAAAIALLPSDPKFAGDLVAAAGKLYAAATEWAGSYRSYCRVPGPGNTSICQATGSMVFSSQAMEVPADSGADLAGQVQCWVPAYDAATCLPKMTLDACMQSRVLGNVYLRWGLGGWRADDVLLLVSMCTALHASSVIVLCCATLAGYV